MSRYTVLTRGYVEPKWHPEMVIFPRNFLEFSWFFCDFILFSRYNYFCLSHNCICYNWIVFSWENCRKMQLYRTTFMSAIFCYGCAATALYARLCRINIHLCNSAAKIKIEQRRILQIRWFFVHFLSEKFFFSDFYFRNRTQNRDENDRQNGWRRQ